MSILISVIIPTYNRVDLLRQTLDSLGSPDARDREVIVVDDGSTDGTRAFLESRPGLSWYGQENAGPSTARNLGASKATGEYLAFLDSDDLWFPWTESVYRQVIGKTHAAFIAGKPFLFEDPQSLSSVPQCPASYLEFADYLESGNEWRWWGCSSFVMERAAFLSAGGFTGKRINAEDIDLTLRMGTARGFAQITAPATFAYRQHAVSEMKNQDLNLRGIEHVLATQKAGGYPGSPDRSAELWRIVTRHLRPAALSALRSGNRPLAWKIYRATLPFHLRSGRWKFILGFLLKSVS